MKKLFLFLFLFSASIAIAQKKHTLTQRNLDELKTDLAKAERGLDMAKSKLEKVQNKVRLISQEKVESSEKTQPVLLMKIQFLKR